MVYLDDLAILSKSLTGRSEKLQLFDRLTQASLKLRLTKCNLLRIKKRKKITHS